MIQPLSLDIDHAAFQTLTHATRTAAETNLDEVSAQRFTIASGDHAGRVVAFLRSSQDDFTAADLWLVSSHDGRHVGMFSTYEGALNGIMAQAYKVVSDQIEHAAREIEHAAIRAEAQKAARKWRLELRAHYVSNGAGQQRNQDRYAEEAQGRTNGFARHEFLRYAERAHGAGLMVLALEAAQ